MEIIRINARIVDKFLEEWYESYAKELNMSMEEFIRYYSEYYEDIKEFADRVSGQEVVLLAQTFDGTKYHYFEEIDECFQLPEELFIKL